MWDLAILTSDHKHAKRLLLTRTCACDADPSGAQPHAGRPLLGPIEIDPASDTTSQATRESCLHSFLRPARRYYRLPQPRYARHIQRPASSRRDRQGPSHLIAPAPDSWERKVTSHACRHHSKSLHRPTHAKLVTPRPDQGAPQRRIAYPPAPLRSGTDTAGSRKQLREAAAACSVIPRCGLICSPPSFSTAIGGYVDCLQQGPERC